MRSIKILCAMTMAVILSLLMIILSATAVLAAETLNVSPSSGPIDQIVTISGRDYDFGDKVYIFFSSEELDEGDDIEDLKIYEQISTYAGLEGEADEGEIRRSFSIPDELTDGDEDEVVHGGEYFFYTTYSTSGDIQAKDSFIVFGITSVDPAEGEVGTEVEIEGVFDDDEDIEVFYDGNDIDIASGDDQTDDDGEFQLTIIIPESSSGEHTVRVEIKDEEDEVTFTVEPSSTVSTTSGMIGDTVTVSGTGFGDTAAVTITFGGEQVATGTTDSNGSFSINFDVPAVAAGTYDIEIEDDEGNQGTTVSFTMITEVTISPVTSQASPGHVGMDLTISGTGFKPNAEITITYTSTPAVFTTASDADGNFSYTFKVPPSEPGMHTITATDGTNAMELSFYMESQAPPIPAPLLPLMDTKPERPILFDWGDVSDPSGFTYTLQVASDRNFSSPLVLEKKGLTKSEYTMTVAEDEALESTKKEAPYYWRVKAIDGAGNESGWSGAGAFHVGFVLALPNWALYLLIGLAILLLFFIVLFVFRRRLRLVK